MKRAKLASANWKRNASRPRSRRRPGHRRWPQRPLSARPKSAPGPSSTPRKGSGTARDRQPDPPLGRRAAARQFAQGRPVSPGHRGRNAGRPCRAAAPDAQPRTARREAERAQAVEGLRRRPEAHRADRGNGSAGGLAGRARSARGAHPGAAAGMAHDQQGHRERRTGRNRAIPAGVPGRVQAVPGVLRVAGRGPTPEPRGPQAGARATEGLRSEPARRTGRLPVDRSGDARGAARVAQPFAGGPRRTVAPPRSSSSRRWTGCARC